MIKTCLRTSVVINKNEWLITSLCCEHYFWKAFDSTLFLGVSSGFFSF